jgi:hypothetical protein
MRHRLSIISLSLAGLELSHSFQPKIAPISHTPHWSLSSSQSTSSRTQLNFGNGLLPELDPALVPALTASASLFVGAAGTLVYNRIMAAKEKDTAVVVDVENTIDIKALEASIQTMVPDKKQQERDDLEMKKFQVEIDLALQAANVAIENASPKKEEEISKAPAALLESLAAKNNGETTYKESKVARQ